MTATRTLAVSSGLGALFLLHGCGDKTPVGPDVADSDTPAPPAGTDVGPVDGDVPPPPAVGGSWGDLVSYVDDQSQSRFKKQHVAEFADEYLAKKVRVDSSPDGKLFPAHAAKTTVSVILNDWNISEPCTQGTKDDLQLAFMKQKKNDLEKLDLPSIKEFGQLHTVTQNRGSVYVADPAIIDDSEASKWTKAVFYKVLNDKTKVWVRDDDEKKRKDVVPNKEAGDLRMNMVVVFTEDGDDKDTDRRPYGNYNNFGMALVTPKDLSSPIDVFKSSMETFEILYTVMASAKKMEMRNQKEYELYDNYAQYLKQQSSGQAEDMNWWGAYAETDNDSKNSPVPTSKVGGHAPEFGRADKDDVKAVSQLKAITTAINAFFRVKNDILEGNNMGRYSKATNKKDPVTSLKISEGQYAGACQHRDDASSHQEAREAIKAINESERSDQQKKNDIEALLAEFEKLPLKEHEDSLFFLVKAAMVKLGKPFGGALVNVKDDGKKKENADAAKLAYKNRKIYDTYLKRQVLHQIMFAEFEEYAFKAHLVQNAVLEFYGSYVEDNSKGGPQDDDEKKTKFVSVNGKGADILVPNADFQKYADFKYSERMDNFMQPEIQDVQGQLAIWDPLFCALGELNKEEDVSKIIPGTKQGWLSKKDEMKVGEEIVLDWKPFKFPSQMHLSTAEIKQIFIGVQSDKAEINAAIYAALVAQLYQKVENNEDKKNEFYLAVADAEKARKEYVQQFKNGHFKMQGQVADDKADRIPEIVLAGSAWSDAKVKAESLFSEKKPKKQQGGSISADGF